MCSVEPQGPECGRHADLGTARDPGPGGVQRGRPALPWLDRNPGTPQRAGDQRSGPWTQAGDLARSLQDSLLPPLLRPVPGLDIAARYLPASGRIQTVVGDFYDLYQARGRWWTAVIGDVCGKGTEAAKVAALARYTLRADAGERLSPATVLDRLNAAMLAQRAPQLPHRHQATSAPPRPAWPGGSAWPGTHRP